jgi:beta-galactosidase
LRRLVWLGLLIACRVASCYGAQSVMPAAPLVGAAWYPEQWPEARWDADLDLMEKAHFHVVRIGEFAWSSLEPSEGKYELGWMDRAIALAQKHHIQVVIGTPTDAPPAWLTVKYPETLGVNANGAAREHGGRRQFNYASPKYRELCRKIDAVLAERFGKNVNVIGWQIGNEYTDESFDAATKAQFQQFLHRKYGTLQSLNEHWATTYWSQTYSDWSQIPFEAAHGNPGLLLEHKHFVTATWRSFQKDQIDELRKYIAKSQFITTNIGGLGWSDNWDHYAVSKDLDIASWDDYVGQGHLQTVRNAMLNDFVRGWRRANFWVMETQPGSVNWAPVNNALDPGETRALAWQTVGHGADAVLYWQWRAALNGQEEYHGAIVGPDGSTLPLYGELVRLGEDFEKAHTALQETQPASEVALLHTYDSRWAIDFQPHSQRYDQQKVLLAFYGPLEQYAQRSGHAVDVIDPTQDGSLAGYKLLVAPGLNVISKPLAEKLAAWVRDGGHLLLGPRSGMKDEFNALNPERQPGPLAEVLGARVDQYYALDASVPLDGSGSADIWAEDLKATSADVHVDLRYGKTSGGWLDGRPAMVTRTLGKGTISYLGTLPDDRTMATVLDSIAAKSDLAEPRYELPKGVELCVRRAVGAGGREVLVVINHSADRVQVKLPGSFIAVVGSDEVRMTKDDAEMNLEAQGVVVLRQMNEVGR